MAWAGAIKSLRLPRLSRSPVTARVVVLSAGTDGIDGPTTAAGAIVDGATVARGRSKGCDAAEFLARNDSYSYLNATGDLLITGPTHTNVMDIQVMLAG